jgi:Sulfotransferase family
MRVQVDGARLIFVAGLHRSGTTPLARALAAHPQVSGLTGTNVEEDEGQHVQDVYPVARTHGGPGRFALRPAAHLTETSPLASPDNAAKLWASWSRYWDVDRPFLLEKSPPNLIMGRFLQALFPGSALIVVIRHPVIVTLSTKKWAPRTSMHRLMENWVEAHRLFRSDLPHLHRVTFVRYEDLVAQPASELARVGAALGLDGDVPAGLIQSSRSSSYEKRWADMATGSMLERRRRASLERDFAAVAADYGYDLTDLHQLGPRPELADLADDSEQA